MRVESEYAEVLVTIHYITMLFHCSWLTEERDGGFPFVIDQQFKLAIAITASEFKFAVNGNYFASYSYKAGSGVLDQLNGFKTYSGRGLQLEISNVDHIHMGVSDCDGFEGYSHPDVSIY